MRERGEGNARRAVLVFAALLAVALLFLCVARFEDEPSTAAVGWALTNFWLLLVFQLFSVLPHELGHALVAHWVGFRVLSITAGVGPRVGEWIVAGVRLRIHAYPLSGFTQSAPREPGFFRIKMFLHVAAGPAVHAALLAGALVLSNDLRIESVARGPRPALALVGASLLLLAVNLAPRKITTPAGVHPSDGLMLLRIPFLKPSDRVEALSSRYVGEAQLCREQELLSQALAWLERGMSAHRDSPSLHHELGFTLALLGQCEDARREFLFVAERPGVSPTLQAIARNNLAWADVVAGPNDRLEEAERVSREALAALGWMPAIKGTRGAVLIEMGRIDEGVTLVREALKEGRHDNLHPMARATYWGALALGLLAQGQYLEARECLETARSHYATCPLLPRVEAAVTAASGPVAAEISARSTCP